MEEEGDDRLGISRVVGDEEPGAAFGFFVGLGLVYGLGEDRDTAGAGAGGEVARVGVEPEIQPLFSGFL